MKFGTVSNLLSRTDKKTSASDKFNKLKELLALNSKYKIINTRLNYFLNKIDEGLINTDLEGKINGWNSKALELLNLTTEIGEGKNIFELLPWIESSDYERAIQSEAEKAIILYKTILNNKLQKKNLRLKLIKIVVDGLSLILITIKDSSREKEQREELFEVKLFAEYSRSLISVLSLEGNMVYMSPAFQKVLGSGAENMLFKNIRDYVHPSDIPLLEDIKDLHNAEFRIKNANGGWIWIEGSTYPLAPDNPDLLVCTAAEITERKEKEKRLLESHEKYRTLIETSPDAVALINLNGRIILGNETLVKILGYNGRDEITGENYLKFIAKESRGDIRAVIKEVLNAGSIKGKEYIIISKTGRRFFAEASVALIMNKLAQPESFLIILRDITERKKISDALKYSEMRFRLVWENSNDGMRLTDKNGNIIAVNDAYCKLVGLTEDKLLCQPYNIVYGSNLDYNPEKFMEDYDRIFQKKEFELNKRINVVFQREKKLNLDVTYSLIEFENYDCLFLGIFRDVTLLKQTEEDLRNSEKLAAIGKMAAYLSHEIKTPLSSIKANLQMLFKDLKISPVKEKSLDIIQREVKRLDKLLKNVLTFSRQVDLVYVRINIRQLISNIADLQRPYIENKNITFLNSVNDIVIQGDYPKLHSVFLHIIENSIDAIGEGGEIEISSQKMPDSKIAIYVRDSGSGIVAGSRIFDPFYTSKASGTGLGLSIAQKIIEQHNGTITLLSGERGKTIFEIILYSEG